MNLNFWLDVDHTSPQDRKPTKEGLYDVTEAWIASHLIGNWQLCMFFTTGKAFHIACIWSLTWISHHEEEVESPAAFFRRFSTLYFVVKIVGPSLLLQVMCANCVQPEHSCSKAVSKTPHTPVTIRACCSGFCVFRGEDPQVNAPDLQVDLQLAKECHNLCFSCVFWHNYSATFLNIEVKQPPWEGKMITA